MRIYLRAYDIDNVGYDINNYQAKPTQATDDIIRGISNINRTQLTFRNINLLSILGYANFHKNKTLNIKLVSVRAINENGNNVIDYESPAQLRTSNIVLSGLNFYNGKNENILTQFTNFNPNEELVFDSVYFHRGDLADFQHYYQYTRNNQGGTTNEFYRFLQEYETTANVSLTRFRVNSTTITQLNNKIMRAGRTRRNTSDLFIIDVADAGDGTTPLRVIGQINNLVTITVLPENNQWFQRQFTDDIPEDDNNIELTAYMPTSYTIDLTFELRDILTNQLQPVISEPNNKVYPSLEIILDIN